MDPRSPSERSPPRAGLVFPVSLLLGAGLFLWLACSDAGQLSLRLPAPEDRPVAAPHPQAKLQGTLRSFDGIPSNLPGAWPAFRGPLRNGITSGEALARTWSQAGPRVLWSREVGEGHAGPAVRAGRVYLHDYDPLLKADVIRCMSLDDGRDIWSYSYPLELKRNHGMSRTVPAVNSRYLVALSPKCRVTCLEAASGKLRWAIDLVRDHGARVPPWYAGQCPLLVGQRAILAPAGTSLLIAVDCESGEVLWKSPNPHGWKMTHSSVVPWRSAGKDLFVYCASGGVVGVEASSGALLWEYPGWKISIATIPSPTVIDQRRLFLSGGYKAGAVMLSLEESAGRLEPREEFRLQHDVFGSTQHTPIYFEGHLYGVRPDGQLVCLDESGALRWTSSSAHRFGLGPYLIADGLLFVLGDEGLLTLVEATPEGYRPLAQARVLEGHDAWAPMALASGRLLLRDLTHLSCIDVGQNR